MNRAATGSSPTPPHNAPELVVGAAFRWAGARCWSGASVLANGDLFRRANQDEIVHFGPPYPLRFFTSVRSVQNDLASRHSERTWSVPVPSLRTIHSLPAELLGELSH